MNEVQKSILDAIDKRIAIFEKRLEFDKTLYGKVASITNEVANVIINDETKECRIKDGVNITIGDVVLVKVPNNNMNFMYIDGKLKRKVV